MYKCGEFLHSSTVAKVDNNLRFTIVFGTWKIVNSFVLLPYEVFAAQLCVNLRGQRFEPAEFRTCTLPLRWPTFAAQTC